LTRRATEQYGKERTYLEEKLVAFHREELIRLSALHDSGGVLPFERCTVQNTSSPYARDGNYKSILFLGKGAEFLEGLATSAESESPKRSIGF
jgi:hypothetical protein